MVAQQILPTKTRATHEAGSMHEAGQSLVAGPGQAVVRLHEAAAVKRYIDRENLRGSDKVRASGAGLILRQLSNVKRKGKQRCEGDGSRSGAGC